jgi:hypothetical protein
MVIRKDGDFGEEIKPTKFYPTCVTKTTNHVIPLQGTENCAPKLHFKINLSSDDYWFYSSIIGITHVMEAKYF